jgi:translation initiation factor 2A
MPAKTMLFDQRVRTLHDFGSSPHNFISFNPQGRLIALAGFGNLAGKIDIFDRRVLNKVCSIDAPNTSHCEWSPDGRVLLTATLSPRLRVDNGIKIWHCSGPLVHIQSIDELYQTSWRPAAIESVSSFGPNLPPAPEPSESVRSNVEALKQLASAKPAGAYRPPGARGLATPAVYKREDEGGAQRVPTNGAATPPRVYNKSPAPGAGSGGGPNGHGHQNGVGNAGRRHVPGAAHSPGPGGDGEKRNNRKRKTKEGRRDGVSGEDKAEKGETEVKPEDEGGAKGGDKSVNVDGLHAGPEEAAVSPVDGILDPMAKKIRNLSKKVSGGPWMFNGAVQRAFFILQLKAIEDLKEKAKRGERLEATQLKKMDGEAEIRKELALLNVADI